jgi:hypothetical protein
VVTYRQLSPDARESHLARTSRKLLARYAREDQSLTLRVLDLSSFASLTR